MAGTLGTIIGAVRLDVQQAVAAYATLRAQNARTVYAMRGMGDSFVGSGRAMGTVGVGLVAVFAKVVSAAAEFERKMDFFAAVTDTSADSMQRLSKFTLQLATDTIYSADQIAEGFIELGKSGITAEQIMGGVGKAMANLGAAGDIPLAQSGQIITSTIQQFDLAARDATHVTDLLAGAANASIADITDLGVSLKYVGGVANVAGLGLDDTVTALSLLAKAGIRGSTAGTSLRQMIVSLPGATGPARDALSDLGILLDDGTNLFYDQTGAMKPLNQVFQILQDHTQGLTKQQKLLYFRQIFNNRALSAAAILTREGAGGFREMSAAMSQTTAADVARKRLDNLSGDIEILRGNIETLLIQAGGPFQEVLRGWVQNLTKLVQAFSRLSPETQKNIVATIGITGAVLTAMGAFLIAVGTVFRFVAAMIRMGAAIGAIIKFVRGLLFVFGLITGGAVSATFLAIAGAVLVVIGAFVLAYKKITPFRELVNNVASAFMSAMRSIGSAIGSVIAWFANLGTTAPAAWNTVTSAVGSAVQRIIGFFQGIGSTIANTFTSAIAGIGAFVGRIVGFFTALPGRVIGVVSSFVSRVSQLLTFRNIGYAIGFMVGTVVKLFIGLGVRVGVAVATLVARVITFFQRLPGRLQAIAARVVASVVTRFIQMRARAISLISAMVAGIIAFFAKLPGRIARFITSAATRVASGFANMYNAARRYGPRIVNAILDFFQKLPGRIGSYITSAASRLRSAGARMVSNARQIGSNIYNGVVNGIQGLPGAVAGIAGRIAGAFRAVASSAMAAARDVARGMWEGFKDGLGISSPSYLERAMWQITDVVGTESKKLARQTMEVQAISKKMAATQFGVEGGLGVNNLQTIVAQQRVLVEGTASLSQGVNIPAPIVMPAQEISLTGMLDLHPNGMVTIRGVAQEVVDDNANYDGSVGRMKLL